LISGSGPSSLVDGLVFSVVRQIVSMIAFAGSGFSLNGQCNLSMIRQKQWFCILMLCIQGIDLLGSRSAGHGHEIVSVTIGQGCDWAGTVRTGTAGPVCR